MLNIQSVRKLIVDITFFRKGTTQVEFNFVDDLIIWQESTRWTRNFTRSFNKAEQERIKNALCEADLTKWHNFYPSQSIVEGPGEYNRLWHLSLTEGDGTTFVAAGKDSFPRGFELLSTIIGDLCHQLFTVMD